MRLTVGIPTYNRAKFLFDLLESISHQLRNSEKLDVEILISDNASTDNTADVVRAFKNNNTNILCKYNCNESNLGYDQNVDKIFHLASGDYVMTLGDDDGLEANAIPIISAILRKNFGVKVVYIANCFYDASFKIKLDINIPFFINVGKSRYFKSADELFLVTKEVFGGISGLCLERKSWLETNVEQYFGTNWIHLGGSLSILKKADIYVITQPLIKYRMDNKAFRWDSLKTSLGIQRVLIDYYEVFPKVIEDIYIAHRDQTRKSLLNLDSYSRCVYRKEILILMKSSYYKKTLPFFLVDVPMLYCPSVIVKLCRHVIFFLKYIAKLVGAKHLIKYIAKLIGHK